MPLTLSNSDRFFKSLSLQTQQYISNKAIIKYPTAPQTSRHTRVAFISDETVTRSGYVSWSFSYYFSSCSIKPDSSCLPCLGTIPHYNTFPWINGFLKISYRYGFTTKIFEVQQLFDSAMHDLFTKMHSPDQCLLYPLLPSPKDRYITVRHSGHGLSLIHI